MNNARMTVQTLEKDSNMRFQVRRMLTGLAWSVLELGAFVFRSPIFLGSTLQKKTRTFVFVKRAR